MAKHFYRKMLTAQEVVAIIKGLDAYWLQNEADDKVRLALLEDFRNFLQTEFGAVVMEDKLDETP